ncbi:hypothetical protein [Lentzea californiensis]|uniref:hypothetical protein n=1 Tax=Lentzea californiensis TaxID=438851 RepID=UPI0021646744|nr:hypothetical protein [Lentzea californiensis]MCR3746658.1 hypothetical protein [Lentzea californiensis]
MSTTITAPSAGTEPTICELLATWHEANPPMGAPDLEVAAWFEQGVRLLKPITSDPAHPQHITACEMAAEYSHDALAMHESARSKGATR